MWAGVLQAARRLLPHLQGEGELGGGAQVLPEARRRAGGARHAGQGGAAGKVCQKIITETF